MPFESGFTSGVILTPGSFTVTLAVAYLASMPRCTSTAPRSASWAGLLPLQVTLDTAQWNNGVHALGASLADSVGNIGESSVLSITVQN